MLNLYNKKINVRDISEYIKKYTAHVLKETQHTDNIQAECIIEEYVKIFFMVNWLRPPILPTKVDINTTTINIILLNIEEIRTNGAIFCHVKIMLHCAQLEIFITWGNQKWNGAIPILTLSAIKIIIIELISSIETVDILSNSLVKINIIDAIACTIKYLIAVSVDRGVNLIINKGIRLIRLISSPNHLVYQVLAEQAKIVPIIKVEKKTIW